MTTSSGTACGHPRRHRHLGQGATAVRARPRETSPEPCELPTRHLIAVIAGVEPASEAAAQVAAALAPALEGSGRVTARTLTGASGIGGARAARLLAAVELAHRVAGGRCAERLRIGSPEAAVRLIAPELDPGAMEQAWVILLDPGWRVIRLERVGVPGVGGCVARPLDVYRPALTAAASHVVLAHAHPSGDPGPSVDDEIATDALRQAGEVVGVHLVDHLIVAAGGYVSMRGGGWDRPWTARYEARPLP